MTRVFHSIEELRAHYRSVRARLEAVRPAPVALLLRAAPRRLPPAQPAPQLTAAAVEAFAPYTRIMRVCARRGGLSHAEFLSDRRDARIVEARFLAFYLARKHTRLSLAEIGRRTGDRDHTTVLHGMRKIEARLAAGDAALRDTLRALKAELGVSS